MRREKLIQVKRPGAMSNQQTNMPVMVWAKLEKVTCRLHTVAVVQRDGCKMGYLRVPGSALVRWMEDPAFRFRRPSPKAQLI
jgi:hypothetical protein